MIVHDDTICQFIKDMPIDSTVYKAYPILPSGTPSTKRKEVVMELHSRLLPILQEHVLFNQKICRDLFSNYDKFLDLLHVHLLVNAPKGYEIYHTQCNGSMHIYIDLIQIADQTPIVSQMMYILEHEISKFCIQAYLDKKLGKAPQQYHDKLDYHTFKEGFTELLSWNSDMDIYRFSQTSYEKRKQQAFGMLYEIMQIENPNEQVKVFFYLNQTSFWERCTSTAGMFYLYDIYHESGSEGLKDVYQKGYHHFIKTIFS